MGIRISVNARDVTSLLKRGESHNGWLEDNAVDPEMGPIDLDIAAEDHEERLILARIAMERSDAWVRVFLTGSLPWDNIPRAVCPTCKGNRKRPGWYCGRCDTPKGSQARTFKPKAAREGKPEPTPLGARVETRKERRAKQGKTRREAA